MTDMICSLLHLPEIEPHLQRLAEHRITLRRVNPWERTKLQSFLTTHFSQGWADEVLVAFSRQPVSCFVALYDKEIVGFAAYECTRRGFFGPTGVNPAFERKGIGTALLLASLQGLRELGYVYAAIGSVGSVSYYEKTVGAIVLPFGDQSGVYQLTKEPGLYPVDNVGRREA